MTTFNLAAIMDGIAATLVAAGVSDAGHTWAWPVATFNTPCAIVGYRPGNISFDMTFKRGADEATLPVWFVAGLVAEKASRDLLSGIIDGAPAVKSALEAQPDTLGGKVSSVRVIDCEVETFLDGNGVEYLAARFDVHVIT